MLCFLVPCSCIRRLIPESGPKQYGSRCPVWPKTWERMLELSEAASVIWKSGQVCTKGAFRLLECFDHSCLHLTLYMLSTIFTSVFCDIAKVTRLQSKRGTGHKQIFLLKYITYGGIRTKDKVIRKKNSVYLGYYFFINHELKLNSNLFYYREGAKSGFGGLSQG